MKYTVRVKKLHIDGAKLKAVAATSPEYHRYAKSRAERWVEIAKAIFVAREVKTNQGETSETSPPRYLQSFFIDTLPNGVIRAGNSDETFWVEHGAHAGGKTPVLGYRPMTLALDALEAEGRL